MMTSLKIEVSDRCVHNYLGALVGKLFKIIPLKQSGCETLQQYIEFYMREMMSFAEFVDIVGEDSDFFALLLILRTLAINDMNFHDVKHDVQEGIRLCKKLQSKYGQEVVS